MVAVFCLSLGVGANTAIFSVVNSILLRPLPFLDSDRLAMVREVSPDRGANLAVAAEHYQEWKDHAESLEALAAYHAWTPNLTGVDDPERLVGIRTTADLFEVLGVLPEAGNAWTHEQAKARERVVVVSHSFAVRRFGADRGLIGRTLLLDGESHRVAAIMPPNILFPTQEVEVWAPLIVDPVRDRGEHDLQVVLRRRNNVALEQARAECTLLMQRLLERDRDSKKAWQAELIPLRDWYGANLQRTLWILAGAVSLVLLIACANVANLLLAHGAGREQEFMIRSALGATRLRLIAQLLTEGVCLGLIGGGFGLVLAQWGRDGLLLLLPGGLASSFGPLVIDWRVLAFTLSVSLASGLIFGSAPAFQASRTNLNLHQASTRVTSSRLRFSLLVSETALALMLLAGAGLLIRSFVHLYQVDPGFAIDNTLTAPHQPASLTL